MMTSEITNDVELQVKKLFDLQKQNAFNIAKTNAKERITKIKKVMNWVLENEKRIADALFADHKKHPAEVKISEIMPIVGEAKYIIKHLAQWMRPEDIETPLKMIGTISKVIHEAKGNCLIISPWNYPFNLAIKPLLQAISAGNVVILKPSEVVPHASKLISEMIAELFEENEIAVVEGDADVSTELLKLKFSHIFFTGSPAIGKVVMAAAAKNLTSITLELGGKSPTIIDETANIKAAAQAITAMKFLNNGQTCIAPDYIYIHESKTADFINEANQYLSKMYGNDVLQNPDYCRVVNNRHYGRVKSYLDDAVSKGAKVVGGGHTNDEENYIEPTILKDVNDEMKVMQEEIFGPILPILEFSDTEEVIDYVNKGEKPLALYIFSKKRSNINYLLQNTSAGASVINETTIHYLQDNLPFGGVNNSGIGKSFGKYGFEEFSNKRAIVENKFAQFSLFHPPYTNRVMKMLDIVIKWF
ncbi:aldehyde dehydrogenase family protein [Emticicia aquatica]|nr:aldehyde dehydrogenase family protein [Emticicia aquatica]